MLKQNVRSNNDVASITILKYLWNTE